MTGKIPTSETISDYYPLTKEEISKLLTTAANNKGNVKLVSEVQVRLDQGIVGITCPRQITGKVAEKLKELDNIFIEEYEKKVSPDTVDKLYKIMTRK
jgi:hypothetical protein